jgi:L-iditol 2-dehydrogenase
MPTKFELETLAFTILIGVANRGIRALEPQATETMVIVGGGSIGICAAQLAMLEGAVPVIIEKDPERLDFIKRIVPNVVSPDDPEFVEKLKETAPAGFDYLYDSVGHAPTTDRLVQLMRNHATMMMQAQYFDKEKCAVDLDQIKIKEITIKTTCGIDAKDRLDTVENILTRRLKVASLITHRFNSDEILKGYELLDSGKPFNLGIVFHWSE